MAYRGGVVFRSITPAAPAAWAPALTMELMVWQERKTHTKEKRAKSVL
ncbi:MAG: hypothetical protein LBG42_07035 [Treponema sp.]|nr:hypothetical protein [Treponema sp.]